MIALKRLDNIEKCAIDILERGIQGDFLEAGIWRGGASIFMRAILKNFGINDRLVWFADSFNGLPIAKPEYPEDRDDKQYQHKELAVSLVQVKSNFQSFDLLDKQVNFIEGWFDETLFDAPFEKISLLRLDGDMYESTFVALEALYHKVSVGGYVIVDDYGYIASCKKAVHDFLEKNGLYPEIHQIDWTGVYWKKDSDVSI